MQKPFKNVSGSLNALLVLEAAVRHESFTKAASELQLTQPSVSRHVANVEARLGCALFHRVNNRLFPTEAGHRLADAVALGLSHAETVWESLSRTRVDDDLVLATTFGFADQWLLPRFSGLKQHLGEKRVRLVTSDWMEMLDMDRVDAAIVWDLSRAPERPSVPLFAEEVFPVCSPDYLRRNRFLDGEPSTLVQADLLHFDVGASQFLTWERWFARCGIACPSGRKRDIYDAYPFLLQAAREGRGVALGWRFLVERLVEEGALVQVGPKVNNREVAYYLQYRASGARRSAVEALVSWFRQETRAT